MVTLRREGEVWDWERKLLVLPTKTANAPIYIIRQITHVKKSYVHFATYFLP